MGHFFLTERLLTEGSFLSFVSKVYEDFVSRNPRDYEAVLAKGQDFKLTAKKWLIQCRDERSLREEQGVMLPFREFALLRMTTLLTMDIDNFTKELAIGKVVRTEKFLEELKKVRKHFETALYLTPVKNELLHVLLERIPPTLKPESESPGPQASQAQTPEYLIWNGSLRELCECFSAWNSNAYGTANLNYKTEELAAFLQKSFRDSSGREFPLTLLKQGLEEKARVSTGR